MQRIVTPGPSRLRHVWKRSFVCFGLNMELLVIAPKRA